MKKVALAAVIFLALLSLGQSPAFEGKFVVKINQWDGLYSDEPIHGVVGSAIDMLNMDIRNENGRSFIQQRQGFIFIDSDSSAGCLPQATSFIYGMHVSQINGDSERVFAAADNGVYEKSRSNKWIKVNSSNTTKDNCTFMEFKDTLFVTGSNCVWKFAKQNGSPGIVQADVDVTVYTRMFLHQDRVYGYGVADSVDSKLVWWPEFFTTDFSALPDTIQNGGYVYIGRDDGDFLTNVMSQQNHIIAYKSRAIYKIMISPSLNAPNEIVKVTTNIGAYGFGCVSEWNGDHYFVAENGVYKYDGVNVTKLSDPINYWFADSITVNTGRATIYKTAVVDNKLYVTLPKRISLAQASGVDDSRTFVYDLDLQVWYKHDFTVGYLQGLNATHHMIRYEYSPASSASILPAGIYYGQKLLFCIDSADNAFAPKICMYPVGWQDKFEGRDSIYAHYEGSFFPVADLYQRWNLERVLVLGRAGTLDTLALDFYSDRSNTLIDSVLVPLTAVSGGDLVNRRVPLEVTGSLVRFKIRMKGGAPKINRMEFVGMTRGLAEE